MKLRIVSWNDYQHYKDRAPPWIKLHQSILTSESWILGNDASRCLMIACMLLASRSKDADGSFCADPKFVQRVAYLNTKPDFKPLIDNGFLEVVQDASSSLALCNTEERRVEQSREEAEERQRHTFVDDSFESFWQTYPKKTGKGAARKAWEKARPDLEEVLHALSWQTYSEAWTKEKGAFIPNPATYINQERWADQPIDEGKINETHKQLHSKSTTTEDYLARLQSIHQRISDAPVCEVRGTLQGEVD
jgi:hypothetical protein